MKYLKWLLIPLISILIGIFGEIIYNLPIEKQNDYQYVDTISVKKKNFQLLDGCDFVSDGGEATLTINFEKQYVDKFTYNFIYDNQHAFTCEIIVRTYPDNQHAQEKVIEDKNNVVINQSTTNVRAVADQIKIVVPEGSESVTISKIAINNTGNYSIFRAIFVMLSAFFGIVICICWKKKVVIPLANTFLCITILIGSLSVAALPSHRVGFDEEIHFGRAYFLEEIIRGDKTVTSPYGVQQLYSTWATNWPNSPQSEEEEKEEDIYRNSSCDYKKQNIGNGYWQEADNYAFNMNVITYIFPHAFIKVGMLLKLPFVYVYKMGRLANVILYAILGFLAIRKIPIGKRILFLFLLMPTAMMSAITYTYDAWVNGFSFLGMAYLLGMWLGKEKRITWKEYIITVMSFVLASMPKAVYIPLILIIILIPQERFQSKKQMYFMKAMVIGAFLIMMSSFVWPTVSNINVEGDSRGGDTSVSRQLQYVFSHPLYYATLVLSGVKQTFYSYTIGEAGLATMGLLPNIANTYLIAVAIAYVVGTDCIANENIEIKFWHKIGIVVIVAMTVCLIWTALYLSFTPVGLNQINGVQGRYFLPLTIWMLLLVRNKKIVNKMNLARDYVIVISFALGILLPIIYKNVISVTF